MDENEDDMDFSLPSKKKKRKKVKLTEGEDIPTEEGGTIIYWMFSSHTSAHACAVTKTIEQL